MSKRILLVDDVPSLLAAAGLALRNMGYVVTSTNSGADALCLLKSKPPPDLLILDLHMPGIDGFDVLRQLGPTAPPVMIITGSGEKSTIEHLTPTVVRVLHKPFEHYQLAEAVRSVLAESSHEIPVAQ